MKSARTSKQEAFSAAIRRFPHFALPIRRLIETDETFLEICEELGEAEFALSRVGEAPAASRDALRAEWQELVDRLAGEAETIIRREFSGRRPGPVLQ